LPATYKPTVKPQLTLNSQQWAVKLKLIMIKMADKCDSLLFNDFSSIDACVVLPQTNDSKKSSHHDPSCRKVHSFIYVLR